MIVRGLQIVGLVLVFGVFGFALGFTANALGIPTWLGILLAAILGYVAYRIIGAMVLNQIESKLEAERLLR